MSDLRRDAMDILAIQKKMDELLEQVDTSDVYKCRELCSRLYVLHQQKRRIYERTQR